MLFRLLPLICFIYLKQQNAHLNNVPDCQVIKTQHILTTLFYKTLKF